MSAPATPQPPIVDWVINSADGLRLSRCEKCGQERPDVRRGPDTGERRLCNNCWFKIERRDSPR